MSTDLVPVADLEKMARAVAASKLFGMQTPEQAMALMLVAQAEGLHPATAARDYHIIQGRPALKADAMLARYLNTGGKIEWHEHTDERVSATFSHPSGGTLKIDWDMARAKKAGLGGKDNWSKYPRQMLRARVISEGVRATNPAVAVGDYTVEETQDFEPQKRPYQRRERDMGTVEVVQEPPAAEAEQIKRSDYKAHDDDIPDFISADMTIALEDALKEHGVPLDKLLSAVGKQYGRKLERLAQILAADYNDAMAYVLGASKKA